MPRAGTSAIARIFARVEPSPHDDGIPVKDMLQELGEVVVKHGYVRLIPAGTRFYRIRIHERTLRPTQTHELGPPPEDHSLANRMSPAGISRK